MIIATIDPTESNILEFKIDISGTKNEPEDIRFIIESVTYKDKNVEHSADNVFSVICRVVKDNDVLRVYVPKIMQLFQSGLHRARLEIVLENRIFTPINEEIELKEPITIKSTPIITENKEEKQYNIIASLVKNMVDNVNVSVNPKNDSNDQKNVDSFEKEKENDENEKNNDLNKPKSKLKKINPFDASWRINGFHSLRNPFA